jgi:hypothetical protein
MRTNEDSTMTFSYDDYSVVGLPQSQAVKQDAETPLYDLSGRRISSPLQPNQIYIGGGKKRLSPSTR